MSEYWDSFLAKSLDEIDPVTAELVRLEEERQRDSIILIPSESMAPRSVRHALGSVFNNVYAEGYPSTAMIGMSEAELSDLQLMSAHYDRYGDRRYYQGAGLVDVLESLTQRRCAQVLANDRVPAEELRVNLQALSGAAANLAVYEALLQPGDTIMGMDLYAGGHITHGSRANLSGKRYEVASYRLGADGHLNYASIRARALERRPKVIIAGYTSYPWAPDWTKFREIADEVGAYLMADIAHVAGLVIAGVYPSPVGYADIINFTTHKSLGGPRGAVIVTPHKDMADRIDHTIFPGIQGGPHPNKFAAMAVAFHIASTPEYRRAMERVVENAQALSRGLTERGVGLAYGGTNTHLMVIDLKTLPGKMSAVAAAQAMEQVGLVANKNTIPGDKSSATPSGIRLGTPWMSQRGMGPVEMDCVADCIARVLKGMNRSGKLELDTIVAVQADVRALTSAFPADVPLAHSGKAPALAEASDGVLLVRGHAARSFLDQAVTAGMAALEPGSIAGTLLLDSRGKVLAPALVASVEPGAVGEERFLLKVDPSQAALVTTWLRGLSSGIVIFDRRDGRTRLDGPVAVTPVTVRDAECQAVSAGLTAMRGATLPQAAVGQEAAEVWRGGQQALFALTKPYFIGLAAVKDLDTAPAKPAFSWTEPEEGTPKRTPLWAEHKSLGGRLIPFAGWDMPVWYSSVGEEHRAVREAAGLFDVAHMAVFEMQGPRAVALLNTIGSNDVLRLQPGGSQYTYLLGPDGHVIDDVMVYSLEPDRFIMVANASNADKDWAWITAVNEGRVLIDNEHPSAQLGAPAVVRNLGHEAEGVDRRVGLAIQGPKSLEILNLVADSDDDRSRLEGLRRTEIGRFSLSGIDALVSRTGYTGETYGYEVLIHPDRAVEIWRKLLEAGKPLGLVPTGLAARDSARIEPGLPLYGHELAGPLAVLPQESGFGGFLKYTKPFYVGRRTNRDAAIKSQRQLVRFKVEGTGHRALRGGEHGEPVLNGRGAYIGRVTSAALVGSEQMGMALIDKGPMEEGATIYIMPLSGRSSGKAAVDMGPGDTYAVPIEATVMSRFAGRG